jgi:iron complex outermembrane receptor protein
MNTGAVLAADAAGSGDAVDEIIVTGTRESGIRAVDSPAPIQVVSAESLKASGAPDLMSALAQVVPSLQMQAFGFDMAGQTLQARLRGLSPNDVLVLVNGKRRHTTANLAVDTGSPFQGGAGVDLNFIPLDSIDHVEVLTDGAAAQYGSDAIAGVVNIILKKNSSGGDLAGIYGQYGNNGGGKTEDISGNVGLDPGSGGYFSLTGNFRNHGHSDTGAEDPRLFASNIAGYTPPNSNVGNVAGYPNLNLIQGDAAVQQKTVAVNAGWDFAGGTELYLVATYGRKNAASYENYRMPNKVNYTPADGGATVYPDPLGFNPQEANVEDDYQFTAGIKGTVAGWDWDLSSGYGGDRDALSTLSTVNTGYYSSTGDPAAAAPSDIYDGTLQATQWTSTLDIKHKFDVGLAGPLNIAFGIEHRRDTYSISNGPPISYIDGGASSYPGFTPLDASSNSRTNDAGYIDFAVKPVDQLQLDAAARFEHYSDFGSATVGKLNARYDFSPAFALRGTISNGFRAPTLAEEFYSSTNVGPSTAFVQLPPNSPAGELLGLGNGLQPEKSIDFSIGAVWRPIDHLSVTLDAYQIAINNRIVGSGNVYGQVVSSNFQSCLTNPAAFPPSQTSAFPGVSAAIAAYAKGQNVIDPDVIKCGSYGIAVFANGIDTKTDGADLVFQFPFQYDFGKINWSVAATYNKTEITKYAASPAKLGGTPLYDVEAYSELTTASPKYVINLGAELATDKLSVALFEKIYGPSSDIENDDGDGPTGNLQYFTNQIKVHYITNLEVGFQFTDRLKLAAGAQNLFNTFPDKMNATILSRENAAGDNAAVQQYPLFSPFGENGGFYYVKASYKF